MKVKLVVYFVCYIFYSAFKVLCNELEDFEFISITVLSTNFEDEMMTVSQPMEQQNEVPNTSSDSYPSDDYTESPEIAMETPSMETINNNQGQSIFNMWLHLNQGYKEQKSKERYCINKMAECLADTSSEYVESQTEGNIPAPDFLVPEPNNQYTIRVSVTVTEETTYKSTTVKITKATEEITTQRIVTEEFSNLNHKYSTLSSNNNIKCNTQNFMRLRECCPHTPGDLISGAVVFACAEGSPVVPRSLLREYSLNLGQAEDKSINFTSTSTFSGQLLGGSVCFVDCLFRKRAMINSEGDLDISMLRYHLTKAVSGSWQLPMLKAIDNCGKAIKFVHPNRKMYRSASKLNYCLVHPFLMLQCIRKSIILECVEMKIHERHPECISKLEALKSCDIFKIPPI